MKKAKVFFLISIWLLFGFYLLLPEQKKLPVLPESFFPQTSKKFPNSGKILIFYTNFSREKVVEFYQKNFSHSSFFSLPLLTYRLSYPPEKIKEVLGKKERATYVEEVVHPLRSSLFIFGYEWEKDPLRAKKGKKMVVEGKTFKSRVTLYWQSSSLVIRILIFLGISFAFWLIILALLIIYDSFDHHRQFQY